MLYVFHVDSGRMMTFDMSLALESVANLKIHVQNTCNIAADKQVLLISGGECLDPNKRVCSYSAGTDTNPIFLFSKQLIESPTPPAPCVDHGIDPELEKRVREHLDMPVALTTVVKRTQLAQRLHELAEQVLAACERLVLDQHLQQQGWSAVVANLEDITVEFGKRAEVFELGFREFMGDREAYISFLKFFHSDLEVLQRIPVLSVLLELEKQSLEESKTSEETLNTEESSTGKEMTLFEWISTADSKNTMDQLYEHCTKGLETFNEKAFDTLKCEIAAILQESDNNKMKEVKGLGERLFGLENLIIQVKKLVKHQSELAQSFVNNQSRASNTKDPSVLPDLCTSHKKQLQMMAQHHRELVDIRRRIFAAKEELSVNLYHRLRWVMYVEDKILEIDHKLVIYYESLKRLRRHLEVLQQIHLAPATYLSAIAEVVRRRAFSQSFLLWASEVACHLLTIHNEEVTRRKEFQAQFDGHFLNALFPGMDDLPPSFATQAPSMFDTCLPKITQEDVDRLKKELPDLAENLNIPDTTAVTNFFLMKAAATSSSSGGGGGGGASRRSLEGAEGKEDVAVEERLARAVDDVGLGSQLDRQLLAGGSGEVYPPQGGGAAPTPPVKDLERGCESETDTEEFEKVGQSPLELHFDKRPATTATRQDVSTLTAEDNLQISRSEHDKLKSCLLKMQSLAREATVQLKNELADLKNRILSDIVVINEGFLSSGTGFKQRMLEYDNRNSETLRCIRSEYENVIRKITEENVKEMESVKEEKVFLEAKVEESYKTISELRKNIDTMRNELECLENRLAEKEEEKEKIVKEINREHKAELENIRSRFKLMTMERSPSDTSLEKSGEFSSLTSHTTLLAQMAQNFELDKEKAISEALRDERERWEKVLAARLREMERKFEEEKEALLRDVAKKVSDEKDRQIRNLSLECLKQKSTIQQLAESSAESGSETELMERLSVLQREKEQMEVELERMRAERADMVTSVTVCEATKVDVQTSPIKQPPVPPSMIRSDISTASISVASSPRASAAPRLNIDSCRPGDLVLVIWDQQHESFRVLQENKHTYFLHSDYLEPLGLEVVDGRPNRTYCTGEVVDKEYCHARKSENRYKVPKGTKFFRVKVRPVVTCTSSAVGKDVVTQSLYHPRPNVMFEPTRVLSQSTMEGGAEGQPHSLSSSSPPVRDHPVIPEDELDSTRTPDPTQTEKVVAVGSWGSEEGEPPVEVVCAGGADRHFAEDSGIVDSVEEGVALDETLVPAALDDDQQQRVPLNLDEQHSYISTTWLEMMLSRVFSKSVQND